MTVEKTVVWCLSMITFTGFFWCFVWLGVPDVMAFAVVFGTYIGRELMQ